jgi:hypothetical protein
MTLASLLSLTGQKCKMNMITGQTAFHYLTTGKKCDCWKRILIYPLNIYNTGNPGRCKSYKSSKKND